jgi:cytosine/creatinine deaminase
VTGALPDKFLIRDRTQFFVSLDNRIAALGGLFNAHLHIDRAETLEATLEVLGCSDLAQASAISLTGKHALIPMVHASACYDPLALEMRVGNCIDRLAALGTARADSVVDVTDDRVGFQALDRLLAIADKVRGSIEFRVGAYSPLGFRDDAPGRWTLIEESAGRADFLGALPERDDRQDYPDHIGFEESCRRFLDLAYRTGKSLHLHVDQRNHDHEAGAELVLRLSREMGLGRVDGAEPLIWLVHMISPSTYDKMRFAALAAGLAEEGIGVICCPSAAISMRQIRPIASPTGNSIARVLELLAAGVHMRLGSDNVCDITSPAGTLDLRDELFVLAHALRFYDIGVLARLAAGQSLTPEERARVVAHLEADRREVDAAVARYRIMGGR